MGKSKIPVREEAGESAAIWVARSELHAWADNPRKNDGEPVAKVAASIKRFGFASPIIARTNGEVIAGHTRLKAAEVLGLDRVPVRYLDLDPAEAHLLALADNKLNEEAEWHAAAVASLLSDYSLDDAALAGWDSDDLEKLANELGALGPKEVTEDEVPEVPVVPITKTGDLWILGEHRVLCGDSTKSEDVARLMGGEKANMMFTDPPYGVGYSGGVQFDGKGGAITNNRERLKNDDTTRIYNDFLPVALAFVDGPCYMWFSDSKTRDVYNAVYDNACEVHALIIWHKTNATYAAMNAQYKQRHEPCLYFKPKGSTLRWCGATTEATVWSQDRDGINEFHPTQKPVALAAKAIGNHEAATVLDLFLGSGSTLIAAEQLGRKCYGIEISPQYCDVIVKRWENLTGKKAAVDSHA
jgi:DNA modification methylase